MSDHDIMREMAIDYRREAESVADPARRDHLVGLADYCQKMAAAMERVRTARRPPQRPTAWRAPAR